MFKIICATMSDKGFNMRLMNDVAIRLPLDKMSDVKIDVYGVVVFKDVQSIFVTKEEDIPNNRLTGRYKISIGHEDIITSYLFDNEEDAIELANIIASGIRYVDDTTGELV